MDDESKPEDSEFLWDEDRPPMSPERRAAIGWGAFTRRLEKYLLWLRPQGSFGFEVRADDDPLIALRAPYVQFAEFGPGWIRAEVSSNDFIAPEFWLDEGSEFLMRRMGWQLEAAGNWFLHDWQERADEVSASVVRVLREVFTVPTKHDLGASPEVEVALGITRSRSFLDK